MGIKMDLGSSQGQAGTVSSLSAVRIAAYEAAIKALTDFANESELKGTAYDSAKNYALKFCVPLFQAAVLYEEGAEVAIGKIPSGYTSEVGGESLDQDVLETQIKAYESSIASDQKSLDIKILNESTISSLQDSIANTQALKNELQEKLNKLIAFDATSATYFTELPSLESAVSQGLSQMTNEFTDFDGSFDVPPVEQIAWTEQIAKNWEQREQQKKKESKKLEDAATALGISVGDLLKILSEVQDGSGKMIQLADLAVDARNMNVTLNGKELRIDGDRVLWGRKPLYNIKTGELYHQGELLRDADVKHRDRTRYERNILKSRFDDGKITPPDMTDYHYSADLRRAISGLGDDYKALKDMAKLSYERFVLGAQVFGWDGVNKAAKLNYKDLKDLAKASMDRLKDAAQFNPHELGKAAATSFKDAINPINDFKGWGDATKLGKFAKGLGIVGTALTVGTNASKIDFSDGIQYREGRDFVLDTSVDLAAGAAAAGAGAAVGSMFLPPLGTVVGAGVGLGLSVAANSWKFNINGKEKSLVDIGKDGVKELANVVEGIGSNIANGIQSLFGG
ncbi:hypothetical protein [Streptococcus oricebi]|uniref:LXG domain-containing protein n=1 Tax=Streptococcus oricebi TaxID=1547447 RepID=A0ABS5B5D3_9STRE|nr:hypothetical protein [Streptococcus oricebi]MBP2624052.1 hypothetical protein [Streptococcus oricebi]